VKFAVKLLIFNLLKILFIIIEEVLNSGSAIWFSEDGLQISYATFNDTKVEELKYPWFGTLDEGKLYPDTRSLRYPKVNQFISKNLNSSPRASYLQPDTPNPSVTLWVVDLADPKNKGTPRDLKPPSALDDE